MNRSYYKTHIVVITKLTNVGPRSYRGAGKHSQPHPISFFEFNLHKFDRYLQKELLITSQLLIKTKEQFLF